MPAEASLQPAPATADAPYDARRAPARVAAALLIGLTQGLSINLVSTNLTAIQGSLGATAAEATWLTTAYFATQLSAVILITKVRFQFGLRVFADFGIAAFLAVSFLDLFTRDLGSAVAARAALGFAAATLGPLTILYMVQSFPKARALTGAVLGVAILQLGSPISRIISEDLLLVGQWRGLHLFEVALAIVSFAVIRAVRLDPIPRQQMLNAGDVVAFPLYAAAMALFCIVLGQGRLHWWTDAPWLGVCLACGLACFTAYVAVELNRERPMLDLHWLTRPFMLRFLVAVILFRIVLSEQTVGAVGLLNALGLNNDQMHVLFGLVTFGTLLGFAAAIALLPLGHFDLPAYLALVLIGAVAIVDSHSTSLTRPGQLYVTQTLLASASSLFVASAFFIGFSRVVAEGGKNIVSFVAVFSGGQALGGLIGSAWLTTYVAHHQTLHYARLVESLTLSDPLVATRLAQLSGAYARNIPNALARTHQGVALLGQQVMREATVLAYDDLFSMIAVLSALTFVGFGLNKVRLMRADARARRAAPPSPQTAAAPAS